MRCTTPYPWGREGCPRAQGHPHGIAWLPLPAGRTRWRRQLGTSPAACRVSRHREPSHREPSHHTCRAVPCPEFAAEGRVPGSSWALPCPPPQRSSITSSSPPGSTPVPVFRAALVQAEQRPALPSTPPSDERSFHPNPRLPHKAPGTKPQTPARTLWGSRKAGKISRRGPLSSSVRHQEGLLHSSFALSAPGDPGHFASVSPLCKRGAAKEPHVCAPEGTQGDGVPSSHPPLAG